MLTHMYVEKNGVKYKITKVIKKYEPFQGTQQSSLSKVSHEGVETEESPKPNFNNCNRI